MFEFNKNSPLVSYQASKELDAGNHKKALEMLSAATESYPDHLIAHILKSLALAHNKKFEEAKTLISGLKGSIITGETIKYYMDKIDKIKLESDGISVNFDDTVSEVLSDSFLDEEQIGAEKDFELLEDDFEFNETGSRSESVDSAIVTETLAEIYASQHNYDEALEIYEKLKKLKPEMSDKFEKRISELKAAIENKKSKKFGN